MTLALDDSVGFEDPANEAPEVTAAKDRNTLAIVEDMDRVKTSLNEFDRVNAGLAELAERYPVDAVYPVETTKGMKDAIEHRAAWRDPRIMVEKARKMAKAPLLALGKNIDARAAWLTSKLEEGEKPVDQQIKAEESRREEEKRQRAAAEAGRIIAIQEALAEIAESVMRACAKTSVEVRALSEQMHATQPDAEVFQEMLPQAKEAWAAGIAKLETALKAKLWDEAEQERIAAERAAEEERRRQEAERLEAQRVENERREAEQRAEREKLEAERREFEREKAELARQKQEAIEAREREEAEALAARERQEAEAMAAQQAAAAPPPAPAPAPAVFVAAPAPMAVAEEEPTLSLGEIKNRIAPLSITAEGLEQLGFDFTRVKAACMYRHSQWPAIHRAMVLHLSKAETAMEAA